jgi:1-aminocyclopropane-1-carboxylate deaminase/D-cysteine desulfhydrase-like pyridoxal-dependent ACC family enzyme
LQSWEIRLDRNIIGGWVDVSGGGGTFRGIIVGVSLKKLKMRLVGMNKSGLAAAGSEAEVELSGAALQRLKSKQSTNDS